MKNKRLLRTAALVLCVMMAGTSIPSVPVVYAREASPTEEAAKETIHINNVQDLKKFMEACIEDSYSRGRIFRLEADLDVRGEELTPIAIFCGILDGNGHTIQGFDMKQAGSDMGFIRFLETEGIVRDLTLEGKIQPEGTSTNVGGLVGTNRGTLERCKFRGEVIARESVGGLAGNNEESGCIISCINEGKLLGTKKTGGIAGTNDGQIENCMNRGEINATSETVSELNDESEKGMTLDFSLDLTSMATDDERITSTGGIVGLNAGTVLSSSNYGAVGYPHVGYRTGGIAGYQRGCVDGCQNEGRIQGRKDTGGIAGLFEPYVEINYNEGTANKLRDQMDDLIDMLDELSHIAKDADGDTLDNMDSVDESIDVIKDSIDNYKTHYQKKNDEFIDDMEEALDIVEKRIDMLDFNVNGEEIANAILGMRKDMEEALKILEALKSMSGANTTQITYVIAEDGQQDAGAADTAVPDQDESEADAGTDQNAGSGSDTGKDQDGGSSSDTGKDQDGGNSSDTGKDQNSGSSSDTGKDQNSGSSSDAGKDQNSGSSSDAGKDQSSESSSDTGKDQSSESSSDAGSARGLSMEDTVLRAAPTSFGDSLPENVKALMKQLGISEDELMKAMIDLGWNPGSSTPEETAALISGAIQKIASEKVVDLANNMNAQSSKLSDAAKDAVGEAKSLADNADKLGTEIKHVIHVGENHIKSIRDDLRKTDEDLSRQMDVLDGRIDILKDRLRDANDDVIAQMDRITDQMRLINDTASDGLDQLEEKINDPDKEKELSDYYDDLSDSDDTSRSRGKVLNSVNAGEIISDINGGGIVGFLSVELFDGESEFEIEKIGNRSMDSRRSAVGTIYHCKNRNEVTAQNDYAGGIVGRADLGAVIACQNYGDVATVDGDYAGGIAGRSAFTVRDSYTLCNITGNNYAGGVAGEGKNIKNSCAMTSIFSEEGEKSGAIAGDADGEVSGNYFVEDGIAAVNGLTYASQAAPITYEELIAMENTPVDFRKFTIRFLADDEEIKTITCSYGDSLKEQDIPETPRKDGILGTWDKTDFTNIRRNMVVRAVYGDWTTALSSGEEVPNLLISGQFLPNAVMEYSSLDLNSVPGIPGYQAVAAYEYRILDDALDGENVFGIHVLTDGVNDRMKGKICAAVIQDGRLRLADGRQDGRYYVFEMPSDGSGQFVVLIQEINWKAVGTAAAAVVLLAGIFLFRKGSRRRKTQRIENDSSADHSGSADHVCAAEDGDTAKAGKTEEKVKKPKSKKTKNKKSEK